MGYGEMRVLCTGDLHLGRGSTKIPNPGSREFSCCGVWDRIVQYAVGADTRVDCVLLSGDLVDRENRLYEGYGALKQGVETLISSGIRTFAVSGNHDFDVLPRISREMDPDAFCLLGADGEWEIVDVKGHSLRLVGWSFPQERVSYSPLSRFPVLPNDDVPTIGMLHASLNATGGEYAPVSQGDLQRYSRFALWLLGHIHLPVVLESPNAPIVLNPGSPQAMDPGEHGIHGPWVADIRPGRQIELHQIPLSTAVYRSFEVKLDGLDDLQCQDALTDAIKGYMESDSRCDCCCVASYRVTLTGETDVHAEMQKIVSGVREQSFRHGDLRAHLDRVDVETRPKIDPLSGFSVNWTVSTAREVYKHPFCDLFFPI